MASFLPNGAILSLATTYGAAKTVTALTNAAEAVSTTSAAHGVTTGAFVEVTSGWNKINSAIVRAKSAAASALTYEGQDTTNTTFYPIGTGIGSFREITAFTQISQVLEFAFSGGEMGFTTFSFLDEDFERQMPTQASPITLTLGIADDPSLPYYAALKNAAASRANTALKMTLPNGGAILYNGIVSFNPIPTMSKGEIMKVTATFSLQGPVVRYTA